MTSPIRAVLLVSLMSPVPVAAQAPPPTAPVQDSAVSPIVPDAAAFVAVREPGSWRVSDLRGRKVYGAEGSDIGEIKDVLVNRLDLADEIKDVLVNRLGEVTAVLVGVGGFLGIGEKDVAVSMKALEFGPPVRPAPAATGSTDVPGAPAPGLAAPGTTVRDDGLPDRIVLRVTKPQLEQAPRFEDGRVAVQSVGGEPALSSKGRSSPPAEAAR
jgi:sporulation protein YlmC with PRC-barrel domain